MPFQPGNKLGKGRPKGIIDKRTLKFMDTLEANDYDPALTLIELQKEAMENYRMGGEQAQGYFKDATNLAMNIASYVFAKPKSIELITNSPLDGMTAAQKLEAMRQAVRMLEAEIGTPILEISSEAEQRAVNAKVPGSTPGFPAK